MSFSSLYIGILAATIVYAQQQFHFHRQFQFPLHRDPRCNIVGNYFRFIIVSFSSLYIGILAATPCRCASIQTVLAVSVPFTSGSSLQRKKSRMEPVVVMDGFSSLYIGILAATSFSFVFATCSEVSVPFTSGSSLQLHVAFVSSTSPYTCFSSLYIGILAATRSSGNTNP
mgnify:CR=1 FL=1